MVTVLLATPYLSQHVDAGWFWMRALQQLGYLVVLWDFRREVVPPESASRAELLLGMKLPPDQARLLPAMPRACYWPDDFAREPEVTSTLREVYDVVATPARPTPNGVVWLPGCYDQETEVLTREGFKPFRDVTEADDLATLDRLGVLEYQRPTALQRWAYQGLMVAVRGSSLDLLVTPDHRMLVSPRRAHGVGGWGIVPAASLVERSYHSFAIKRDARWLGSPAEDVRVPVTRVVFDRWTRSRHERPRPDVVFPAMPLLEFMGWYISEGSKCQTDYAITITQIASEEKRSRIAQCIRDLGLHPVIKKREIRVHSKALYTLVASQGLAREKRVPTWIKGLEPQAIGAFLSALFAGDGSPRGEEALGKYYTSSSALASDVQELLLKVGATSTLRTPLDHNGKHRYMISVARHRGATLGGRVSTQDYHGMVYCATVPNGTLFVRRNGKTAWCGNSFDPLVHHPPVAPQFQYGVAFIGTHTPYKERMLDGVVDVGLDYLAGNGWERGPLRLLNLMRPAVYLHDYADVLRRSVVSINLHHDPQVGVNRRLYESIACTFTLTDLPPGVEEVLGHNLAEAVGVRSPEDLREKAEFYATHHVEREALWERERAAVAHGTYRQMAASLLGRLGYPAAAHNFVLGM